MADQTRAPEEPAAQKKASGKKSSTAKPDLATVGGLVVATIGIVGGLLLEGGSLRDILQHTAAIIVLGGTFGAVMVNYPMATLVGGFKRMVTVFRDPGTTADALIEEMVGYATKARKHGIVALEREAVAITDPFLRKALNLAVDGTDLQELRKMLELEIELEEIHAEQEAKVWESAGGYSPTIGIIGAVLGLIQVMKNLANIDAVGHGIATAFVATVYGVAFANIFFLPAGNKIKQRAQRETQMKELILEGVIGIVEGLNPKLIRIKLEAYVTHAERVAAKKNAPPSSKEKVGESEQAA